MIIELAYYPYFAMLLARIMLNVNDFSIYYEIVNPLIL